jgi:hypothetical protein
MYLYSHVYLVSKFDTSIFIYSEGNIFVMNANILIKIKFGENGIYTLYIQTFKHVTVNEQRYNSVIQDSQNRLWSPA